MSRALDRDRQRCYRAETSAFGGTDLDDPLEWAELTAIFHAVLAHPWWQSLDVPQPTLMRARADSQRSSADGATIRLARGGHTALTLLHELSHHVVMGRCLDDPGHGPRFRAVELRLAELFGGAPARRHLAEAWQLHGLAVGPWEGPEPRVVDGLTGGPVVGPGPARLRGAIPLGAG
jgi:hypothetical protein